LALKMPSFFTSLTQIFSPATGNSASSATNTRQYPSNRQSPLDPFSLPQHQGQGNGYGYGGGASGYDGAGSRSGSPAFGNSAVGPLSRHDREHGHPQAHGADPLWSDSVPERTVPTAPPKLDKTRCYRVHPRTAALAIHILQSPVRPTSTATHRLCAHRRGLVRPTTFSLRMDLSSTILL
jgi:hypothetical protein